MASIKQHVPSFGKGFMEVGDFGGRELMEAIFPAGIFGVNVSSYKPSIPLVAPSSENVAWKRVVHTPCDENDASILCPVRQSALGDEEIVVGVEEFHERAHHSESDDYCTYRNSGCIRRAQSRSATSGAAGFSLKSSKAALSSALLGARVKVAA